MNPIDAYNLFQEKLFIDLTLTLKDDKNELVMFVHKMILYTVKPRL
jgi:hypothetical protein